MYHFRSRSCGLWRRFLYGPCLIRVYFISNFSCVILKKYLSVVSSYCVRVVSVLFFRQLSACYIFLWLIPHYKLKNSWNVCTYVVKVRLSLCFNWAPRHEGVFGKWRYSSTHSLTSALDGGEWSASCEGRFKPKERAPGIPWIGGWWAPEPFWKRWWREKFPAPAGNWSLEPRSSSP
jgi:hypothetical protein